MTLQLSSVKRLIVDTEVSASVGFLTILPPSKVRLNGEDSSLLSDRGALSARAFMLADNLSKPSNKVGGADGADLPGCMARRREQSLLSSSLRSSQTRICAWICETCRIRALISASTSLNCLQRADRVARCMYSTFHDGIS
eukprot:CAMPEP_0194489830 /NCGR_PEP_ID=MMETSP0253-20130528/9243_1 /TAXON_ID=2966 /ORGANISM="Noctiluca scintillans" /LENGTH=140 /DNA_ID=CAMNT_0039330367 /DNA_START=413 /DNA_END=835 /DNA_ORIENTATION=+